MDWTQIEKDYKQWCLKPIETRGMTIIDWFKQRIESELPPQPPEKLNEEEKNEFYTTNLTADIKAVYERKT